MLSLNLSKSQKDKIIRDEDIKKKNKKKSNKGEKKLKNDDETYSKRKKLS